MPRFITIIDEGPDPDPAPEDPVVDLSVFASEGSYFEPRPNRVNKQQTVDISASSSADCVVVLERSFDDGDTWQIVKTIADSSSYQETLEYTASTCYVCELSSSTAQLHFAFGRWPSC